MLKLIGLLLSQFGDVTAKEQRLASDKMIIDYIQHIPLEGAENLIDTEATESRAKTTDDSTTEDLAEARLGSGTSDSGSLTAAKCLLLLKGGKVGLHGIGLLLSEIVANITAAGGLFLLESSEVGLYGIGLLLGKIVANVTAADGLFLLEGSEVGLNRVGLLLGEVVADLAALEGAEDFIDTEATKGRAKTTDDSTTEDLTETGLGSGTSDSSCLATREALLLVESLELTFELIGLILSELARAENLGETSSSALVGDTTLKMPLSLRLK
jgi:hypothetical protein